jgi:hypothetical protein
LSAADTARAATVKELAARMQRHAADADAMAAFAEAEVTAGGTIEDLERRLRQAESLSIDDPARLRQARLELAGIGRAAKSGSDDWSRRAASAVPVAAMAARAPQVRDRFDRIAADALAAVARAGPAASASEPCRGAQEWNPVRKGSFSLPHCPPVPAGSGRRRRLSTRREWKRARDHGAAVTSTIIP